MSPFPELIDAFLQGIQTLRQAVAGMNWQQLIARPVAGKWSTPEVVCHLVDSDQAWIHRMKRIIAEERPLLIGYDETLFANSLAYHQRELDEELGLFEIEGAKMATKFLVKHDGKKFVEAEATEFHAVGKLDDSVFAKP